MERKCSVCGSPLKRENMYYKCTFCSYFEHINERQGTSSTQGVGPTQPAGVQQYRIQYAPPKQTKKNTPVAAIVVGVVLVLFVVFLVPTLFFAMVVKKSMDTYEERMEEVFVWEDDEEEEGMKPTQKPVGFQSGMMKEAVTLMFNKPFLEITEEDLASIQYIYVDESWIDESCVISFSTQDYHDYEQDCYELVEDNSEDVLFAYGEEFLDTIQTIEVTYREEDNYELYEDLVNFQNLKAINLDDYEYVDLSLFPHLSMVENESSDLNELLDAGLPVEQIEVLKLDGNDLAGIEKFTSLKKLYLSRYDTADLEPIAKCTSLDTLYLIYLDGSRSLACLEPLTNLKTLFVDAYYDEGVKDLSAIASFTELENLAIARTNILNVDFLKDLKKLKSLRITGNSQLKDFEGLSDLPELEYLQFDINALSGGQPEYEGLATLENLKYLHLNTVYNLDFLFELDQLEELDIKITFYNYLSEPLRNMKNLKSLTLSQCNSQFEDGFIWLSELPELKKLTVDYMEFEDPADGLFMLDTLEELRIRSCTFAQPPSQVIAGDNLKVLDLSYTEFVNGGGWQIYYSGFGDPETAQNVLQNYYSATSLEKLYVDYFLMGDVSGISNLSNLKVLSLQKCELTEIAESDLAGCSMLEELYLSGNQISDISFVRNLPNLEKIYLKDCYVTDMTPLMDCTNLQYVDIRNNPIDGNPLEGVEVREED